MADPKGKPLAAVFGPTTRRVPFGPWITNYMFWVYMLQNYRKNHYYIGVTSNLKTRLVKHNNGSTKSTKPYRPWRIIYTETFETKEEAMKREFFLKSPQGYQAKRAIFKQINN